MSGIKNKNDLLKFEYKGICIGRDICDEFLHRYKTHTVNLKDKKLALVILDFIKTIDYWISFLKNNQVVGITLSHVNVRLLAIVGKVSTKFFDIPVYSVTNRYIQKATNLSDHKNYIKNGLLNMPKLFNGLSDAEKQIGIDWAKSQLDRRFKGEVGVDMYYSSKSAFHRNKTTRALKDSDKIKAAIFTHQFYDNPHAYGGLFFTDFYEWLLCLAKKTVNSNFEWYIKNHPDTDLMTKNVIEKFIIKYPHIKLIDEKVSFLQLRDEGLNFAFTCYGTIGYEAPLLGVQVINADLNHPHSAYNFNFSPKNIYEFENMIENLDSLKIEINKNEIYEYYFVSNKLQYDDKLIFKSYKSAKDREKNGKDSILDIFLEEFEKSKHLNIIENINKII